jgi:hypothetical protein
MNAKIKFIILLCLLASVQSMAQMGAAGKITYDIDTTVKFDVSVSILWEAINEPAKWADISNGYIKSVAVSGDLPNQTRLVHFADGMERKDVISQYQPEYRFIVLKITGPLSPAIKDNMFCFAAATDGKGLSSLHFMIKVAGEEREKKELLDSLKKEMYGYITGLTKLYKRNGNENKNE